MTKSWLGIVFRDRKTLRRAVLVSSAVFIFFSGVALLWISSWRVPALDSFQERKVTESTKIYDRTGEVLLYDVFQNIKRTVVPLENISQYIKNATLAIEDNDFYNHAGIKPLSILRATLVNLSGFSLTQGGSTITQQVVKNSLLSGEKRISRKLKEWVLAMKLEKILSKDEIFSMYLNEIPYGGSIYGVEEASNAFFGKGARDVSLVEAAYLAALPKAPTFYSPYGPNIERLEERKNLVLDQMFRHGYIDEDELGKAKTEKVRFLAGDSTGIKAPHFVIFVKELLERKYGGRVLEEGGLKVITTIDYELQSVIEEIAGPYALGNEKNFDAENIATVAIDPKTGQILAMVGSRGYFDQEIDGNFNVTTAHRQPGSAFKPFAYAAALNKGYTPETVIFDVETEFSTQCSPEGTPLRPDAVCYKPTNYDDRFRGPVTMREALAQSINIPSIKTLYLAGMIDTLRLAKDLGIQSLTNINRYGLTLVLGGGEVSLLDITSAYGVFAAGGVRNPYAAIVEVRDKSGNVLESFAPRPTQVLSREVANQISNILSDDGARAPAFGTRSPLYFSGRDVAVKTGTTNDYRDAWVVGYTPNIVVGAWAGNNDNRPMQKKIARQIIVPYWNTVMNHIFKTLPNESFERPAAEGGVELKPVLRGKWQGGRLVLIDKVSGKLATEYTPSETYEERLVGGVHSILYWVDKDNPRGPAPQNPAADPQFDLWESAVRKWVTANGIFEPSEVGLPTEFDDVHLPELAPTVSIVFPLPSIVYRQSDKIFITTSVNTRYPIIKMEYYVNDEFLGSSIIPPFTFSFIPSDIERLADRNTVRVVVTDSVFNKGEMTAEFFVER